MSLQSPMNPAQNPYLQQQGAFGNPSGGLPGAQMPTGGFGMPPGGQGFPPAQDMFAQAGAMGLPQGGMPQAPMAQPVGGTVKQHPSGGFADNNEGLDSGGGGLLSKIFSFKGLLAAGAAIAGGFALKHFGIWPFSKSEPDPTAFKDLEPDTKTALKELPAKIDGAVDEALNTDKLDDLEKVEEAFNKHFEQFADLKLEEEPQAALNAIKDTRQALFNEVRTAHSDQENGQLGQDKIRDLKRDIAKADQDYQTKVVDELNKPVEEEADHDDEEEGHGGGFH